MATCPSGGLFFSFLNRKNVLLPVLTVLRAECVFAPMDEMQKFQNNPRSPASTFSNILFRAGGFKRMQKNTQTTQLTMRGKKKINANCRQTKNCFIIFHQGLLLIPVLSEPPSQLFFALSFCIGYFFQD